MKEMWSMEVKVSSELVSGELKNKGEARFLDDLRSSGGNDGFVVGFVESENMGSEEVRVSLDVDSREIDGKMEVRVCEEAERNGGFAFGNTEVEKLIVITEDGTRNSSGNIKGDADMMEEPTVLDFDPSYSVVDQGTATGMLEAFESETEKALSYEFEPGDMVWGKVKSHPWWPGHIFNEAFASSSVQRKKREGYVLVAFFGDSSYGWFDPAELIPFEPHYAEKSSQTNSRTFMKAVEEAVDEARRRSALGLACQCRNPFNFRPTNVQEYFAVDVGRYEPGAIYSMKQVKKARDSFQPTEAFSFLKQLATMPWNNKQRSIDWIKNMAMMRAFRKAVFEEFDETYAQSFGTQTQPVRSSHNSMGVLDQLAKVPPQAPLSGPLVIAEALGERKSFTKPMKVEDQLKKDKYLFKRRDEPNEPRPHHISPGHVGFVASSSYKDRVATLAPGDYLYQKGPPAASTKPQAPVKQEGIGTSRRRGASLTQGEIWKGAESLEGKPITGKFSLVDAQVKMSQIDSPVEFTAGFHAILPVAHCSPLAMQGGPVDGKLSLDKKSALHKMNGNGTSGGPLGFMSTNLDGSFVMGKLKDLGILDSFHQKLPQEGRTMVDLKKENLKLFSTLEGLEHPVSIQFEDHGGPDQLWEDGNIKNVSESVGDPLTTDSELPSRVLGTSADGVIKNGKVRRRPEEDLNPEKSIMCEKRKKSNKKFVAKTNPEHPQKRLKTAKDGESMRKLAGKSIGIGLVFEENSQMDPQRRDSGASVTFLSDSAASLPEVDLGNIEYELPHVVSDLLDLALNPFHSFEQNSQAIVQQVLLRFRSLVYQKSLVLAPPSEAETSKICSSNSPASTEVPPGDGVKDLPLKKPKHLMRPDGPTNAGSKRALSAREEEMSAKRLKKVNKPKPIAVEKEVGPTVPAKIIRSDSVKKPELLARVVQPTMLVMKFPPRTTLPSIPELKARFGRFGPLDHSAMRVFWKTSTCRVVFKHKSDAQLAYNHAVQTKALFGHVKVNYHLRDVGVPTPEISESAKWQLDDASDEFPQFRSGGGKDSVSEPRPIVRMQQPSIQLKSCLKKPLGDEAGPAIDVTTRESPRVKFKLGGEESISGEQFMVNSSSNDYNNGSFADGASSSIALDVNSKNFQKVISPPQLPSIRPPPLGIPFANESDGVGQFTKAPYAHYRELEPRNNNNYKTIASKTNNIDISHRMLSLLTRCSDIVTNVKCTFGYVPYHPL